MKSIALPHSRSCRWALQWDQTPTFDIVGWKWDSRDHSIARCMEGNGQDCLAGCGLQKLQPAWLKATELQLQWPR